jgi:tetratricopeptide (TPR) repeat protein
VQAASALEHAHALGVIHRDVKPGNLLLDPKGDLWVTDFGLARFLDDPGLTRTGDLIGTLAYMSPEQALGKRVVDQRSDVYSLGATLYELLVLRPPFEGRDRQELLRKIGHDEPVPPRRLDANVPRDLETVVLKAMEKEPHARYPSAKELAEELGRFLGDKPILASRPGPLEQAAKWARRHRPVVVTAATVLLLAMAVGTALLWRENRNTEEARQALLETFRRMFDVTDQITMQGMERVAIDSMNPKSDIKKEEVDKYYQKATDFYELVARQQPNDPETRSIVAHAFHRLGFTRMVRRMSGGEAAYRRAVEEYERLMADQPGERDHRLSLAEVLNDWATMTSFSSTLAAAEGQPRRAAELAEEAGGRFRRAVAIAHEAALRFGVGPEELLRIASYSLGQADRLEAVKRTADAEKVRAALTAFYQSLGARVAADSSLRRSLVSAHVRHGNAAGAQSRPDGVPSGRREAESLYRLALVLDPDNPTVLNDLAWLLAARPDEPPYDPKQAVALADRAVARVTTPPRPLETKPNDVGVLWNTLGVARYRAGDYSLARAALQKSMELREGGDPNDWYFLAMIEHHLGNPRQAKAWFERAADWMAREKHSADDPVYPDLQRFHVEASKLLGLPNVDALGPQASIMPTSI